MTVGTYLSNHEVVQIGTPPIGYICCDAIVDNPDELVAVVHNTEYYISRIQWWDYTRIGCASPIGYGGVADPNNPGYYFAETDILKEFDSSTTTMGYRNYIAEIKASYQQYNIFPSFDIKRRGQGDGLREPL